MAENFAKEEGGPAKLNQAQNFFSTADISVQPTYFSGPLRCRMSRVSLYFKNITYLKREFKK